MPSYSFRSDLFRGHQCVLPADVSGGCHSEGRPDWRGRVRPLSHPQHIGGQCLRILSDRIFSAAINAFSPLMFPAVVTQKGALIGVAGFARCHILSILAANAFVFFLCVAVQGILMNVLGYRLFRRVSPYVQFALVALLILMFLLSGRIVSELRPQAAVNPAAVYVFPPLWFLGLYQTQLGWTNPVFRDLAASARMAAGWTTAGASALYLISYKRHV